MQGFPFRFATHAPTSQAGASEGSEETKHWRGKRLFVNNGMPLQCFVYSQPSDASVRKSVNQV